MKTVMFVIEMLSSGGAERVTSVLANEFCIAGYNVHLVTYIKKENEYILDEKICRYNIEIDKSKTRLKGIKEKYFGLRKIINKVKPDTIISLATPKTITMLTMASKGQKCDIILSERNDPNSYPSSNILKKIRYFCYKNADGVIFQTEDAKNYFSKSIQKKSKVIPNPIKENLPEAPLDKKREKIIVNYCRLEKQKNLYLLIDAFILISNDLPEYKLIIYGDGPLKNELEKYIDTNNMQQRIFIFKFQQDIHNKIKNASLFVSSSNYEGISNSMLEALAIGIPTVCTDCPVGGARMMIKSEQNGILVPVNDVNMLSESMKEVIMNERLANKLSYNSRKIKEELNGMNISREWIEFIENINI